MNGPYVSKAEEHDHKWKRAWRGAMIASLILHVIVVLLFRQARPLPFVPQAAAGERTGDPNAAAGGGMQTIAFEIAVPKPEPTPEEEVVPPEPEPTPEPVPEPPPEEKPASQPAQSTGQQNAPGEGRGRDQGPGTETGTGTGDGGTSEEGLYRLTAPSPRGLILPPTDRPSKMRGKTVTVYVFVNERGRVVSDSTRLAPPTGDNRFDNRLKQQAAEWVFRPGTRGGTPIATWFPYTITL